jgi:hypothetical protein
LRKYFSLFGTKINIIFSMPINNYCWNETLQTENQNTIHHFLSVSELYTRTYSFSVIFLFFKIFIHFSLIFLILIKQIKFMKSSLCVCCVFKLKLFNQFTIFHEIWYGYDIFKNHSEIVSFILYLRSSHQ